MEKPKAKKRPWQQEATTTFARRKSAPFYHSHRWTIESRLFRKENPLCKICYEKGIIRRGQVTDHIIPRIICTDPWDKSNWQTLCRQCDKEKLVDDRKLIASHFKRKEQ
ncbi:MAG TPA: HNH endonuclease signature motif containing protein [Bacteroidales bacterium]|nr:HNH endonuclease signature motif containing protein [Bacteroidales bacterium]